jgi:hypothetical protein
MLQTIPGREQEIDARVRAMVFSPEEGGSCPIVEISFTDEVAPLMQPPDEATVATQRKFKNVPAHRFERELIVRPWPRLPDRVKVLHRGQELVTIYKICAGTDGRIMRVTPVVAIAGADHAIATTLAQWQLRSQQPEPICSLLRFYFSVR